MFPAADSPSVEEAMMESTHPRSRMPSIDQQQRPQVPEPVGTAVAFFEPLGPDDAYDVFDLELVLNAGGKADIDARYRSGDSTTTRPTYKIQKKTKAHFLGKKNMSVEVTRNLGWDSATGAPTQTGQKGYIDVFSANDQSSRNIGLLATKSVLSQSAAGNTVIVSTGCGAYDPAHTPTTKRESAATHFISIRLNDFGDAPKPAAKSGRRPTTPAPPTSAPAVPYQGGGHFILDSNNAGRPELLSTLYCSGYEQRTSPRAGDIVVAELRLLPAGPNAPPPWVRLFKERHASLHIARRGMAACLTGPHVTLQVRSGGPASGRAVLSRGQAQEVIVAALGAALLGIEHDGLEKRWAWLARQQQLQLRKKVPSVPALATDPSVSAMEHPRERSDDSQGPSSSSTAYERIGGSLFAGKGFTPSRTPSMRERERDGASVVGSIGSGIEMEEWTPSERPTQICVRSVGSHVDSVNSPPESVGPRGSPAAHVAPVVLHTTAPLHISKAPRTRGGTWSRKNSNMSERSGHPLFTHPDTPAPWQQQRPPIMVSGHYESQDPFVSLVSEGKPHAYATTENWAIVRPQVEEVMVLSPKRGEEYVFA